MAGKRKDGAGLPPEFTDILAKIEKNPEYAIMACMAMLAEAGVTADEYADFLKFHAAVSEMESGKAPEDKEGRRSGDAFHNALNKAAKSPVAMDNAAGKTLCLKIQLKGVTKPPVWREVRIPADTTFSFLHDVIQIVFGFENSHLWHFGKSAYGEGPHIGVSVDDPFGTDVGRIDFDACETPVTSFLHDKGDKLEYLYDFGDDWIFRISVADITDRDGEVAECVRWKGDMQPLEDTGGIWAYMQMRDLMDNWEKLKVSERNRVARSLGYEKGSDLREVIEDSMFDIERVNEELSELAADCEE